MAPPIAISLLPVLLSVTSSYAKAALNNTTAHEHVLSSESSCTSRRTLWSIITSCVITLFACAWTAMHPNIPGPAESAVVVAARRVYMMILAIGVPEVFVMWAVRQFLAARTTRKQFQEALNDGTLELRVKPYCKPRLVSGNVPRGADEATITIPKKTAQNLASLWSSMRAAFRRTPRERKLSPSPIAWESLKSHYRWTLKHSFYAWMGGFILFIDSDEDSTLPYEVYYPLTPDELLEYLKENRVQMSMVSEKDLDGRSKGDWLSKTIAVMQLVWFIVQLVARHFVQLPTTQLEIATLAVSILSCFIYAFWWYKPKDVQWSSPVYWKETGDPPKLRYGTTQTIGEFLCHFGFKESWFGDVIHEIFHPPLNLQGIHSVSNAAVSAHRVPYYCGYPPDEDVKTFLQNLPAPLIGSLTATVFGGVHCLAWNFTFPSYTEKLLWRISSLAITIVPIVMSVIIGCAYLSVVDGTTVSHPIITTYSLGAVGLLYIVCRFVLVALFLTSLRFLPTGVYLEVCWASHIPHWKT